jgi:hypothetical protein
VSDHRDLRAFPEPFSTAALPDEVVNQRISVTVAVGNVVGTDTSRVGRSAVSVWMDAQLTSGEVGGSVGDWPQESYRGQSVTGFRLTDEERRYVAASLYAAALNIIEHRNEGAP